MLVVNKLNVNRKEVAAMWLLATRTLAICFNTDIQIIV